MKFLFATFIMAVFLVSDLHSVQSTAVARKYQKESQLTSLLPPMAGRSLKNLETFVVTAIQSSTTLTAAEKQSLLSDFFNLISRSSSMGGLIKDLFGIQPAPAPVPPTPVNCDKSFKVDSIAPIDVLSEGYPNNYVPTQLITCTYTFTAATRLNIAFDEGNVIGTGATLKFVGDPSNPSSERDAEGTLASTGSVALVIFTSPAGASSKWKMSYALGA